MYLTHCPNRHHSPFFDGKKTTFILAQRHKPGGPCPTYLYVLPSLNIVKVQATKKGDSDGSVGSKSNTGNHEIISNPQN